MMNNNIYEAPKAIVFNVNTADVITTSPAFSEIPDVLGDSWVAADNFATFE